MTHPHDLLADYVDGTLDADTRAQVDAHLAACDACRRSVAAAARARDALAALPELAPPDELSSRILQAAAAPASRRSEVADLEDHRRRRMMNIRRLTVAAAAGFVLLVVAVSLNPRGSDQPTTAEAPEAGMSAQSAPAEATFDLQRFADRERDRYARVKDYDFYAGYNESTKSTPLSGDAIVEEASSETSNSGSTQDDHAAVPASPQAPQPSPTAAPERAAADETRGLASKRIAATPQVRRCLEDSGAFDAGGELLRVYEADVNGSDAYLAVLLEGPEPGATPDRISVWVTEPGSCTVFAFAQAYLDYPSPSPLPPELQVP